MKIFLAALLAALLLAACAPAAGTPVRIKDGARGCAVWFQAALAWTECAAPGAVSGVVEDHPEGLGHEFNGRVRVKLEGREVLWFEIQDITVLEK